MEYQSTVPQQLSCRTRRTDPRPHRGVDLDDRTLLERAMRLQYHQSGLGIGETSQLKLFLEYEPPRVDPTTTPGLRVEYPLVVREPLLPTDGPRAHSSH